MATNQFWIHFSEEDLLNTRLCDLELTLDGHPLQKALKKLRHLDKVSKGQVGLEDPLILLQDLMLFIASGTTKYGILILLWYLNTVV